MAVGGWWVYRGCCFVLPLGREAKEAWSLGLVRSGKICWLGLGSPRFFWVWWCLVCLLRRKGRHLFLQHVCGWEGPRPVRPVQTCLNLLLCGVGRPKNISAPSIQRLSMPPAPPPQFCLYFLSGHGRTGGSSS